jgi:hypothetical protein
LSPRLWQTDGTVDGTFPVRDSLTTRHFAAVGDRIFTIRTGQGRNEFAELGCPSLLDWDNTYDGSEQLVGFDDRLLVVETAGEERRLWSTDGSASGTALVQTLAAPSGSDRPADRRFVRSGERAYFANRDEQSGRELWALPLSALPQVQGSPCERSPTPTPVPGRPTPHPIECPQGLPCLALQAPEEVEAGEDVTLSVVLRTVDESIVAVQNDVTVPDEMVILPNSAGRPNCTVEPSLDWLSPRFGFLPPGCTPEVDCTGMRALVIAFAEAPPIYDGAVLYRCAARVSPDAERGLLFLSLSNLQGSDADGGAVVISGNDAVVRVALRSDSQPLGAADGNSEGCQTATPNRSMSAWIPIGVLALVVMHRLKRHGGARQMRNRAQ